MWPNLQETADLVTFTEETLIEIFIFCEVKASIRKWKHRQSHNFPLFILLAIIFAAK